MDNSINTKKEQIVLSIKCIEHVLWVMEGFSEEKEICRSFINDAYRWLEDEITMQQARMLAFSAHKYAREENNEIIKLIYRAIGQMLATAHVARHSLHALDYCIKAINMFTQDKDLVNKELDYQKNLILSDS